MDMNECVGERKDVSLCVCNGEGEKKNEYKRERVRERLCECLGEQRKRERGRERLHL